MTQAQSNLEGNRMLFLKKKVPIGKPWKNIKFKEILFVFYYSVSFKGKTILGKTKFNFEGCLCV